MPLRHFHPTIQRWFTERIGTRVDLEKITLVNEAGKSVPLSTYFSSGKPVLLSVVYYNCPSLCGFVLNGLLTTLKKLDWTPGKEFELVTLSMDHREGPELARTKKEAFVAELGRPEAAKGWTIL